MSRLTVNARTRLIRVAHTCSTLLASITALGVATVAGLIVTPLLPVNAYLASIIWLVLLWVGLGVVVMFASNAEAKRRNRTEHHLNERNRT